MTCTNPLNIPVKQPDGTYKRMIVPCGKCMACRVQRTKEWSLRLMQESDYYMDNSFITLTYDDTHLPEDKGLHKEALQDFFKRLRYYIPKEINIKYYACGEYGDQFGRPHYHAIVFGISPNSSALQESWKDGFIKAGNVTYESCQYVASYVQKKLNGKRVSEYGGKQPPFALMSKGLGLRYIEENRPQLDQRMLITVKGVKHGLPRYYKKKLPEISERLKERAKTLLEEKCMELGFDSTKTIGIINSIENKQRDLNLKTRLSLKEKKL